MSATKKISIWGIGAAIGKLGLRTLGAALSHTLLGKSIIDEHTQEQLKEVQRSEHCWCIKECGSFGGCRMSGINAHAAAKDGKTAWEAPNGLWVYHDLPNYRPQHVRQLFRPIGGGKWGGQGGGWGKPITGIHFCPKCNVKH